MEGSRPKHTPASWTNAQRQSGLDSSRRKGLCTYRAGEGWRFRCHQLPHINLEDPAARRFPL